MGSVSSDDILRDLIENVDNIVAAAVENRTECFAALSIRQKMLLEALVAAPPGASIPMLAEFQPLLERAIDIIRGQMDLNRTEWKASGMKKKILAAYGTVTVSGRSRE